MKNGPCDGTRRNTKASVSGTIMAEIPHGTNGRGNLREALSGSLETVRNRVITTVETERNEGATVAPCVMHDGPDMLENIKKLRTKGHSSPTEKAL